MTLKLSENLKVAQKVLAAVNRILREKKIKTEYSRVETYCNGREQGYCIRVFGTSTWGVSISFSEYRSSDAIVVYSSEEHSFSMQGNVPDDEAYNNAKFFNCGEFDKAAKHIVALLKKHNK